MYSICLINTAACDDLLSVSAPVFTLHKPHLSGFFVRWNTLMSSLWSSPQVQRSWWWTRRVGSPGRRLYSSLRSSKRTTRTASYFSSMLRVERAAGLDIWTSTSRRTTAPWVCPCGTRLDPPGEAGTRWSWPSALTGPTSTRWANIDVRNPKRNPDGAHRSCVLMPLVLACRWFTKTWICDEDFCNISNVAHQMLLSFRVYSCHVIVKVFVLKCCFDIRDFVQQNWSELLDQQVVAIFFQSINAY